MKKTPFLLSLAVLSFLLCGCKNATPPPPAYELGLGSMSPELSRSYVEALASDSLEGRLVGTRGGAAAADSIAGWLGVMGVVPLLGDSYFQTFTPLSSPELADFWPRLFSSSAIGPTAQQIQRVMDRLSTRLAGVEARNVLGMIEGVTPDEYIVVGAHYDHLGMVNSPPAADKDLVFNGADDNASGVAGVLNVARAFAVSALKPQRTVIFALWDGEESGLTGSGYFSQTFPGMDKVVAYFNFDMIGRDDEGEKGQVRFTSTDSVPYIATSRADVAAYGLGLVIPDAPDSSGKVPVSGGSDHQSFHMEGIPFYYVNTGMHPDLHRVGDEADKIDYDKLTDISKMAFLTIYRLANPDAQIVYPVTE